MTVNIVARAYIFAGDSPMALDGEGDEQRTRFTDETKCRRADTDLQ